MINFGKNFWIALLSGTLLLLCCGGNAMADDTVYGNTSVRGFKNVTGIVGVGSGGPVGHFRQYSTGVPEYSPGSGPIGIFANRGAATPGTYGNYNRPGNMIDTRKSTIMRANRLDFTNRQSNLANPSSGPGTSLGRQKPLRGQSGNKLAKPLSSELSYAPDLAAPANNWTANTLVGGKYSKLGSLGSESYGGGLAQRKSALTGGQSAFGTSANSLTRQRNQFRYNAANLGQAKNPAAFGRTTGITNTTSLANRASSLK